MRQIKSYGDTELIDLLSTGLSKSLKILKFEFKKFEIPTFVPNNSKGVLLINQEFKEILDRGNHYYSYDKEYTLIPVDISRQIEVITNQEIISKDNVTFRLSFFYEYVVRDVAKQIETFDLLNPVNIRAFLHNHAQVAIREAIAIFNSFELLEKRAEIEQIASEKIRTYLNDVGIELIGLSLKDMTFPKDIQDVFAKTLEEKVVSDAKLYSARAQVAAARALKNASDITSGDKDIKFIRLLETLEKMAQKGRRTFVLSDLINDVIEKN